jgi:hypothetical protein
MGRASVDDILFKSDMILSVKILFFVVIAPWDSKFQLDFTNGLLQLLNGAGQEAAWVTQLCRFRCSEIF